MNKEKLKHLPINLLFSAPIFLLSMFAFPLFITIPAWKLILLSLAISIFDAIRNSEIDYLQEQIDNLKKDENRKN